MCTAEIYIQLYLNSPLLIVILKSAIRKWIKVFINKLLYFLYYFNKFTIINLLLLNLLFNTKLDLIYIFYGYNIRFQKLSILVSFNVWYKTHKLINF